MLLTQTARDLKSEVDRRWAALEAWLADPAHAAAAAKARASVESLKKHYAEEVDRGLLTDSAELCGAYLDLETAESTAMDQGYPKPAGHGAPRSEACTVEMARANVVAVAPTAGPVALAAADYCDEHPKDAVCLATAPQERSWCQRAGAPDLVCDKDGIRDWVLWAAGLAGATLVIGAGYAAYRAAKVAAPFAIAAYAPEALPAYEAYQRGGAEAAKPHVLQAVAEQARKDKR